MIDAKPPLERCMVRPRKEMVATPLSIVMGALGFLARGEKVADAKTSVQRRGDFLQTKSYTSDQPPAFAGFQAKPIRA